jgi:REP element-mobilizing transposase RayT
VPRPNRSFACGQIWHITHRCHEQSFLLRFPRDRRRYRHWLLEARKRFGLRVLNYVITCNHVHLLVEDTGEDVIAQSMQLAAGRTAQEFNRRRGRKGAFWEDRYHATAVEVDEHLQRCLVYIDSNMIRAGVVRHPVEWAHGGYAEIHTAAHSDVLIDCQRLSTLCGFSTLTAFQEAYRSWISQSLSDHPPRRDERWSKADAVGSAAFVDRMKRVMGRARLRA